MADSPADYRGEDAIRIYLADDERGPEECLDVTPAVARRLDEAGLTYEPEDAPGTRWTYIGAVDATIARLQDKESDI